MISVRLLSASGAWLHKRARDLAGRLLRLNGTKRVETLDGFLIQAKRIGNQAQAVVLDLPAVVMLSSRNRDGYGGALWLPYAELASGRDALLVQTPEQAPELGFPFKALMPERYTVLGDLPALDAFDQPLPGDQGLRYCGYTDRRLPGAGALHCAVVSQYGDDFDDVRSKELRLDLVTPQSSQRQITAAGVRTRSTGGDFGARLSYANLIARTGLATTVKDVPFFTHWATAGVFGLDQGVLRSALAATVAADVRSVQLVSGMSAADLVSTQQALWLGGVTVSREEVAFQGGLLLTGPATDGAPYANRYCHNGGQWVVAGGVAYALVSAAGAQTYRRTPGSSAESYAYPWTLTLYQATPGGAVSAQPIASAPWQVPVSGGYALSDQAQCFVLGGCAVGDDAYFLTSNMPSLAGGYQTQLALYRVRAGVASQVQTFANLRAAGLHYMLSRAQQVLWLGGSVIGFVCGNTIGEEARYSNWRVATFDVDTGDLNLGAQPDTQAMWLQCDPSALDGQALRYTDASTGSPATTQFAGNLDCLQRSADGYRSILIATRGGLGCYNAVNPSIGKTYISRDSGLSWSLLINAGSGGAATYLGNALAPCALSLDARP